MRNCDYSHVLSMYIEHEQTWKEACLRNWYLQTCNKSQSTKQAIHFNKDLVRKYPDVKIKALT